MGLTDHASISDVTVRIRHRCPDFIFGSALGPGTSAYYWFVLPGPTVVTQLVSPSLAMDSELADGIFRAIRARLGETFLADASTAARDRQDELAEMPEVP